MSAATTFRSHVSDAGRPSAPMPSTTSVAATVAAPAGPPAAGPMAPHARAVAGGLCDEPGAVDMDVPVDMDIPVHVHVTINVDVTVIPVMPAGGAAQPIPRDHAWPHQYQPGPRQAELYQQ